MVVRLFIIICFAFCISCIYKGQKSEYGLPRPQTKNMDGLCDVKLSKKYEGLYEEKYYFADSDKYGKFKMLTETSNVKHFENKTTYIKFYNNCRVSIFANTNLQLKKEDLNPEKGLIGLLYRKKNNDIIKYYSIKDGVGRTIYRDLILKEDTLIVKESGSNTNGYIYIRKKLSLDGFFCFTERRYF